MKSSIKKTSTGKQNFSKKLIVKAAKRAIKKHRDVLIKLGRT